MNCCWLELDTNRYLRPSNTRSIRANPNHSWIQELRREFSKWSTISYAISILGVLGSVPATFGSPLSAGGPATAVWCWLIGSCMAMCIGSSVAELVSAYPTAGGMYFVTKHVVPVDQVPIFSWIQGWCNLLGQTAGVSSVAYTVSQMLLAGVSMNSDLVDGQYSYSPFVNYLFNSPFLR